MKKTLLFLSLLVVSTCGFAKPAPQNNNSNFYIGAQGGLAYDGLKTKNFYNILILKKDESINMAGRLFIGYNLNKNFGLETGFLVTDNREIKCLAINKELIKKFNVKQSIIDVTPRVNIPVDNFNFYAKAGVAYIDFFNSGKDLDSYKLTYGLGVDYKLTNNISTGFAWQHYDGGSHKPIDILYRKYEPALDFYGVSLTYKIAA